MVFFVNTIVNFIARKILIQYLGIEYNGLNSLFHSIISMLSIAEMGIGTTIIYKLYEPISQNKIDEVNALMGFYKKCYNILAGVVLIIGLTLLPFISKIVGEINISINIYIVYMLFLFDSVFTYLLSYKRSILIANQKMRTIKKIHLLYIVSLNIVQIIVLFYTKNYYLYLVSKIFFTILENILITIKANKLYPYILEKKSKLDIDTKKDLIKRIKAMFFHQIGGFVVNGTDSILLSIMFGVASVGYYNNYFLVISSLVTLGNNIFSSTTASIGNLLYSSNKNKNYDVYNNMNFINFLIASYTSCMFLILIQPFIKWWLGIENLLGFDLVICLTIYYYLRTMKYTISSFKSAAGIFYEDRFVPLIESIVNIVFSILFAKLFGLSGIILGTIVSTLVLYIYSYPKYVYKKLFQKNIWQFYLQNIKYAIFTLVFIIISFFINEIIIFDSFWIELLKTTGITTIIFVCLVCLIYFKDSRFLFLKKIMIKMKK